MNNEIPRLFFTMNNNFPRTSSENALPPPPQKPVLGRTNNKHRKKGSTAQRTTTAGVQAHATSNPLTPRPRQRPFTDASHGAQIQGHAWASPRSCAPLMKPRPKQKKSHPKSKRFAKVPHRPMTSRSCRRGHAARADVRERVSRSTTLYRCRACRPALHGGRGTGRNVTGI